MEMTPETQAKILLLKIKKDFGDFNSKKYALMTIDFHLNELSKMKLIFSDREMNYKYWNNVKKYIVNI